MYQKKAIFSMEHMRRVADAQGIQKTPVFQIPLFLEHSTPDR